MKLKIITNKKHNEKNGQFIFFKFSENSCFVVDLSEKDQDNFKKLFAFIIDNIDENIEISCDNKSSQDEILTKISKKYKDMLDKEIQEIKEEMKKFNLENE